METIIESKKEEIRSKSTKVTEPWKPASILSVIKRKEGMRDRWVRKDLLDKKVLEGWEPVQSGAETAPTLTLLDGTQLDRTVQKRNLILCRMPEELAVNRNKYFQKLTDESEEIPSRELEEAANVPGYVGSGAYGRIVVKEGGKK